MTTSAIHNGDKSRKSSVTKYYATWDEPDLKEDWLNFSLLLLLYTMQGIPLGFNTAIPIILQSNSNVTYRDQASFSVVMWPFTLKLLWAPLVDALYVRKIGRRKTWLVPVQFVIGSCFVYMASDIENLLPEKGKPNIVKLVIVFFISTFMVATQDIVVDGWALTMLKKKNVGYASTCNTTGLAIGAMLGCVSSGLLTSEKFCNTFLRATPHTGAIVDLKSLLYVWGILYMTITILIALLKEEKDCTLANDHVKLNVIQNYVLLGNILKLPSIRTLAITLFTARIGFAAAENVTSLKLIDAGVSKDNIMIMNTAMYLVKMIIPLVIAKTTSGPKPMCIYLKAILIRLFWNLAFVMLIYYTPQMITIHGIVDIPVYYYVILVIIFLMQEILHYITFIALLAFFSRISDPHFGGTYMTLLNTLSNLGVAWTSVMVLGMIDVLTLKECSFDVHNNCSTPNLQNTCKLGGGHCIVKTNGYYVEMALCTFVGILWYGHFKNVLKTLQAKCPSQWLVNDVVKQPNAKISKSVYTITVP